LRGGGGSLGRQLSPVMPSGTAKEKKMLAAWVGTPRAKRKGTAAHYPASQESRGQECLRSRWEAGGVYGMPSSGRVTRNSASGEAACPIHDSAALAPTRVFPDPAPRWRDPLHSRLVRSVAPYPAPGRQPTHSPLPHPRAPAVLSDATNRMSACPERPCSAVPWPSPSLRWDRATPRVVNVREPCPDHGRSVPPPVCRGAITRLARNMISPCRASFFFRISSHFSGSRISR